MNTKDARATVEILKTLAWLARPAGSHRRDRSNEMAYGLVRMVEILLDGVAEVRPFRKVRRSTRGSG